MARLETLKRLAETDGVRFVYLIPPSLNRADIGSRPAPRARAARHTGASDDHISRARCPGSRLAPTACI